MNPTLPLVQELVRRGETLVYYTGEEFRGKVESAGAEHRTYDSLSEAVRFQFGTHDVRSPNMVLMARIMIQFTEYVLPPLLNVLKRERPDYILHDFTCIWGTVGR
jgi:UDP:flavonoid glycosyltransferase YjiC (YdhE family)